MASPGERQAVANWQCDENLPKSQRRDSNPNRPGGDYDAKPQPPEGAPTGPRSNRKRRKSKVEEAEETERPRSGGGDHNNNNSNKRPEPWRDPRSRHSHSHCPPPRSPSSLAYSPSSVPTRPQAFACSNSSNSSNSNNSSNGNSANLKQLFCNLTWTSDRYKTPQQQRQHSLPSPDSLYEDGEIVENKHESSCDRQVHVAGGDRTSSTPAVQSAKLDQNQTTPTARASRDTDTVTVTAGSLPSPSEMGPEAAVAEDESRMEIDSDANVPASNNAAAPQKPTVAKIDTSLPPRPPARNGSIPSPSPKNLQAFKANSSTNAAPVASMTIPQTSTGTSATPTSGVPKSPLVPDVRPSARSRSPVKLSVSTKKPAQRSLSVPRPSKASTGEELTTDVPTQQTPWDFLCSAVSRRLKQSTRVENLEKQVAKRRKQQSLFPQDGDLERAEAELNTARASLKTLDDESRQQMQAHFHHPTERPFPGRGTVGESKDTKLLLARLEKMEKANDQLQSQVEYLRSEMKRDNTGREILDLRAKIDREIGRAGPSNTRLDSLASDTKKHDSDLSRIRERLGNVERDRDTLNKDADYYDRKIKEIVKDARSSWSFFDDFTKDLNSKLEQQQAKLEDAFDRVGHVEKLEGKVDNVTAQLTSLEKQAQESKDGQKDIQDALAKLKERLSNFETNFESRVRELEDTTTQARLDLGSLKTKQLERLSNSESLIQELQNNTKLVSQELESLKTKQPDSTGSHDLKPLEERMGNITQTLATEQEKTAELQRTVENLKTSQHEPESIQTSVKNLKEDLVRKEEQITLLQNKVAQVESGHDDRTASVITMQDFVGNLATKVNDLEEGRRTDKAASDSTVVDLNTKVAQALDTVNKLSTTLSESITQQAQTVEDLRRRMASILSRTANASFPRPINSSPANSPLPSPNITSPITSSSPIQHQQPPPPPPPPPPPTPAHIQHQQPQLQNQQQLQQQQQILQQQQLQQQQLLHRQQQQLHSLPQQHQQHSPPPQQTQQYQLPQRPQQPQQPQQMQQLPQQQQRPHLPPPRQLQQQSQQLQQPQQPQHQQQQQQHQQQQQQAHPSPNAWVLQPSPPNQTRLDELERKLKSIESFVVTHNERLDTMTTESFQNNILHSMSRLYPLPDYVAREVSAFRFELSGIQVKIGHLEANKLSGSPQRGQDSDSTEVLKLQKQVDEIAAKITENTDPTASQKDLERRYTEDFKTFGKNMLKTKNEVSGQIDELKSRIEALDQSLSQVSTKVAIVDARHEGSIRHVYENLDRAKNNIAIQEKQLKDMIQEQKSYYDKVNARLDGEFAPWLDELAGNVEDIKGERPAIKSEPTTNPHLSSHPSSRRTSRQGSSATGRDNSEPMRTKADSITPRSKKRKRNNRVVTSEEDDEVSVSSKHR